MAEVDKPNAPWDAGDVVRLEDMLAFGMNPDEIGHVLGRTPKAIKDKAVEQSFQIVSANLSNIRNFGRKGGVFVREFLGGSIGIRWGRAHRSGAAFSTEACERLFDAGMIIKAENAGEGGHIWWKRTKPRKAKITT